MSTGMAFTITPSSAARARHGNDRLAGVRHRVAALIDEIEDPRDTKFQVLNESELEDLRLLVNGGLCDL